MNKGKKHKNRARHGSQRQLGKLLNQPEPSDNRTHTPQNAAVDQNSPENHNRNLDAEITSRISPYAINMDTFLSTIIQTTAALLAVLLAAIAAYFVFLQGKSADFDDKISEEKSGIRDEIRNLQISWPGNLSHLFPPEFLERYSARNGNSTGAELVQKLTPTFVFPDPQVDQLVSEIGPLDTFKLEHWQSRAYFVVLNEAVRALEGGASVDSPAVQLGVPEPRLESGAVFPRSATGPGFEEWRNEFQKLSNSVSFLQFRAETEISDFHSFHNSQPQLSPILSNMYSSGVTQLFRTFGQIRLHLGKVDDLEVARSRYAFSSRLSGKSLSLLVISAFILGIIVPLFALSGTGRITTLAANILLSALLLLVVGAFVQFGIDVFNPLNPDVHLYAVNRWVRPLKADLDKTVPNISRGAAVSILGLSEVLNSAKENQLSPSLRAAMVRYREAANAYNAAHEQLDTAMLTEINISRLFTSFRQHYRSCPQSILTTQFLEEPILEQQRREIEAVAGDVCIGLETATSFGERGRLSLVAVKEKKRQLVSALEELHAKLQPSKEAEQFRLRQRLLLSSAAQLGSEMDKFFVGK